MQKIDNILKKMNWLTYAALVSLALGLFTSITFVALNHIFIIIPSVYFLTKGSYKNWGKSSIALFFMWIFVVLSVLFTQDIATQGYWALTKSKYYLIALISIYPIEKWYNSLSESDRKIKIKNLLNMLLFTTTVVTIAGIGSVYAKFNYLTFKSNTVGRNGGVFGMLMNYAHNLAFFELLLTGMIIYREKIKNYLNLKFLYLTWAINLFGLYTTYTRGAWLAFFIALPFYFIKSSKKIFFILVFTFAILGSGLYLIAGKNVIRPQSDIERVSQWKAAYKGFTERPVLGLGYLNFMSQSVAIKKRHHIEADYYSGHAHNNYLEMLADTGVLGFVFFVIWQIFWFMELFKRKDFLSYLLLPLIVTFIVGGLTQATFTLGGNLILSMSLYAISQMKVWNLDQSKNNDNIL
jgi:O-antigen ligase